MHVDYLTLKRLFRIKGDKSILVEQLEQLPCPSEIRIGLRYYPVPRNVNEFRDKIVWGQRLMMATMCENEIDALVNFVANYYYPMARKKPFSETGVIKFFDRIVTCQAKELFPVLLRMVTLFEETLQIENKQLNSKPDRTAVAAGINELSIFSDLTILEMIADKCRVELEKEAHLVSYNTVFALLLKEKKTAEFNKKYQELSLIQSKQK